MADLGWLRALAPRSRTPQSQSAKTESEPPTPTEAKAPGKVAVPKAATSKDVALSKPPASSKAATPTKAAGPSKVAASSKGGASSKGAATVKPAATKATSAVKGVAPTKGAAPSKSGLPKSKAVSPKKKQEKAKHRKGRPTETNKPSATPPTSVTFAHDEAAKQPKTNIPSRVRSHSLDSIASSLSSGPSAPGPPNQAFRSASTVQMLDALRSVTMTRHPRDPIPAEYGAHVCHVLEAYSGLEATTRRLAASLSEERRMHDEERRDFDDMATDWIAREARFRAEIFRLERLVVAAQQGQQGGEVGGGGGGASGAKEAVALVRKQSLVHKDTPQSDRYLVRLQSVLDRARTSCAESVHVNSATSATNGYGDLEIGQALGVAPRVDPNVPRLVEQNCDIALSKQLRLQAKTSKRKVDTKQYYMNAVDGGQRPGGVENRPPTKEVGATGESVNRGPLHDHAKPGYQLDQAGSKPVAPHLERTGAPVSPIRIGGACKAEDHELSEQIRPASARQAAETDSSDGEVASGLRRRGDRLRLSDRQRRGWSFEPGEEEQLQVPDRSRGLQRRSRLSTRDTELQGQHRDAPSSAPLLRYDMGISKQDSTRTQVTAIHDPNIEDTVLAADDATSGSYEKEGDRACRIPSASLP